MKDPNILNTMSIFFGKIIYDYDCGSGCTRPSRYLVDDGTEIVLDIENNELDSAREKMLWIMIGKQFGEKDES